MSYAPPQNQYGGVNYDNPSVYGNIDPSQYGETMDYAYPQAPAPPTNNLIATAGSAQNTYNQYSGNLDNMLAGLGSQTNQLPGSNLNVNNVNDAYTQMLDRVTQGEDASTKALIGTINASRSNRANEMSGQYDNYKRGLQLLGIQHNDAQSTPDLLMGHIQQAENEHQAKLQQLDVETNKALMDAKQAQTKNDLATLKEKMDYVDKLKQEKRDYLKNIAEQMGAGSTIAEHVIAGSYAEYSKLSPADQQKYIQHVSASFGIPVTAVQAAIEKQRMAGEDRALDIRDKESVIAARKDKGAGSGNSNKVLPILDIQRYNDIYPDAGVTAGDTEAQANAKVAATNTPEAKARTTIQGIKDGGGTYEEVIKEIGDNPEQLAIAKEVYGIEDTQTTPTKETTPSNFTLPNSAFGITGLGTIKNIISGISSLFD